jgi:hypothetical protein
MTQTLYAHMNKTKIKKKEEDRRAEGAGNAVSPSWGLPQLKR